MTRRRHWTGEEIVAALDLARRGASDRAVESRTGIPRETVRNYRGGRVPARARALIEGSGLCRGCREPEHAFADLPSGLYAYVLGVYLGDGWVTSHGSVVQLRVALDNAWPGVIEEISSALTALRGRPTFRVAMTDGRNGSVLVSNWKQWPCHLPQHGSGRKHTRPIVLEPWQKAHVDAGPGSFLRGLIHTDGWRGVNRVHVKGRDYEYPRYQFSNRSDDIRKLFTDACDVLGIAWTQWTRCHVSVARKDAVARLDEHVGPKY